MIPNLVWLLLATGIRLVGPGLAGPLGPGRQTGSSYSEIIIASAAEFFVPGICVHEKMELKVGTINEKHRSRCIIILGVLAVLVTTAMLSEWK